MLAGVSPLEEKRPEGRACSHFGGPEGNRTPDLFHAKNEIGGSPYSACSADFNNGRNRRPVGGFLVAWGHFSIDFVCQATRAKRSAYVGMVDAGPACLGLLLA